MTFKTFYMELIIFSQAYIAQHFLFLRKVFRKMWATMLETKVNLLP